MLSRTTTSTAAALIHGLERYSVSTLGRQLTLRSTYASVLSRHFSSHTDVPTPTIDLAQLQATIFSQTAQISRDLSSRGYFTTVSILPLDEVTTLRSQAISLRKEGRYVPSFSEKLVGDTIQRFDKEGVYACEPDGGDYYTAPDLISYIATILQTLPPALNDEEETRDNE